MADASMVRTDPRIYDHDYFECGPVVGISGYMNYQWMPELTLRMVHHMICGLPLHRHQSVLDYGCAKGFVVKALRILDIDADGVDVSAYAIQHADSEVRDLCSLIEGCGDPACFRRDYDWMLAKDVFEHIAEPDLRVLLAKARPRVQRIFAAIPLAADDHSGRYVIAEYDRDVTHVLARTAEWWSRFFVLNGWVVESFSYTFDGCKENWTRRWPDGNGFFVIRSAG